MSKWFNIWKRRRAREDYSEFRFLVDTPETEAAFAPTNTTTLTLPGPATILLRADDALAGGEFTLTTGDGNEANHGALSAGEAAVLGTYEEGEEITIEHNSGSAFSGLAEIGIRDPAGRFMTILELTCP